MKYPVRSRISRPAVCPVNPMAVAVAGFMAAAVSMAVPAQARFDPRVWADEWPNTDFSVHSVDLAEIRSGGPPKDGIPALDDPAFIAVADETRLGDREPVMVVEITGETPKAYPVRYLTWHEIVNDRIGAIPLSVTFCPLCNSGLIFDRRIDDRVLSFGVSGKLRNSDMVMYDRETESWWQQFTGEAIVGALTGTTLTRIPGWMESWSDFRTRNADGLVMDEPRHPRPYGANPYLGYDTSLSPFLYGGEDPPHDIPSLARVIVVGDRAWPLTRVRASGEIREDGLLITWKEGTASALDTRTIADGRDVGSIRVRDAGTGYDVAHDVAFAFAFHAFFPEGTWMIGN